MRKRTALVNMSGGGGRRGGKTRILEPQLEHGKARSPAALWTVPCLGLSFSICTMGWLGNGMPRGLPHLMSSDVSTAEAAGGWGRR